MFPQPGRELLLRLLQENGPPEMSPANPAFEEEEILMPVPGSDTKEGPVAFLKRGATGMGRGKHFATYDCPAYFRKCGIPGLSC